MAELPNIGSIVAVTTSRARILHAFEQLLDQCDSADLPELVKLANNKLAQRGTKYNAQHSPLVKLPAELLVEIGKLVMDLDTEDIHDKSWFAEVLPLMQTCKEIRTILQPLRSTSLTCEVVLRRSRDIWDQVFKRLRAWVSGSCDSHQGPIHVLIHTPLPLRTQHPSTAAAMAGALECAIYGTLEVTPCVHMQCLQFYRCRPTLNRCLTYFVGHSREANVIEQSMLKDSSKIRGRRSINRTLSREEGLAIWQETIKESEVRYF